MLPTDFENFAFGFDLNSASYSGGAGGTFTNLKSGGENWTVDGATPTFSTNNGLEGMDFSASSTQSVLGEMRALYEATVLIILKPASTANMHAFGGNLSTANTFSVQCNANSVQAFQPNGSSGFASLDISRANVVTCSWSPFDLTNYVQVNDGTPVSAAVPFTAARIDYANASIGRMRTSYFNGWIARLLVFNRALHFRDNDNLQLLITEEMAKIGL